MTLRALQPCFSAFWAKITLKLQFGRKNCWGQFSRFLWVQTHDFWAIWARKMKNLVWAQKHPKRVCNPLGGPRSPLEAFLSDLPFFWNFEFFVLKCLKNAYFHRSQKVQNFEKVKNRDFERAITFCREARFRWSNSRFVALWNLYKTAVSVRKSSSSARSYGPLKIAIFGF